MLSLLSCPSARKFSEQEAYVRRDVKTTRSLSEIAARRHHLEGIWRISEEVLGYFVYSTDVAFFQYNVGGGEGEKFSESC